jgi:hypothetical protein
MRKKGFFIIGMLRVLFNMTFCILICHKSDILIQIFIKNTHWVVTSKILCPYSLGYRVNTWVLFRATTIKEKDV